MYRDDETHDLEYYKALSEQAMFAYRELCETIRQAGYQVKRTNEGNLILDKSEITIRSARDPIQPQ